MRTNPNILAGALAALVALTAPAARAAEGVEALNDAIKAYNAGSYPEAALAFFDVAENSGEPELQQRAEYFLALSLHKMKLFHSALIYDRQIIDVGPNHPYYKDAVVNSLDVMDALGDKAVVPNLLDKEYNEAFATLPKPVIARINFLVALWGNRSRKYEESEQFLAFVPKDSAWWPRARYLRGVQLAQQALAEGPESKLAEEAVKAFEEVRAVEPAAGVTYQNLAEMKQLSTLALARLRYQQQKYTEAVHLYEKIPEFSRHWRDALFEGAYASFMNGQHLPGEPGRALGMLHTLHAPMAGDQLVPESWLLKAELYYFSCLWDEARAALDKLQTTYNGINKQVKALLEAKREPDFYWSLLVDGGKDGSALPAAVRNELLGDDWLRGYRAYIAELNGEVEALKKVEGWKKSLLGPSLVETVEQQRNLMIQTAGKQVMRELKRVELLIDDIDGQAEIVRFEMAKREKDLLEASFDPETVLTKQKLHRPAAANGAEYWSFDGEYWPDELGFYRYTVKNACPIEGEKTAER